MSSQKVVTS